MRRFVFYLVWVLIAVSMARAGFTQNISEENIPIHLTSDRVVIDEKKSSVVFEGHVVVTRGDITITGSKLAIYGKKGANIKSDKSLGEQLDRIEVEGSVRISQGDKVASSEKAVYYVGEHKILLFGNPVVAQGNDRLSGQMITIYLKDGRSVVEGGSEKPVKVILNPSPDKLKTPLK